VLTAKRVIEKPGIIEGPRGRKYVVFPGEKRIFQETESRDPVGCREDDL
jgi:hypothetical protein